MTGHQALNHIAVAGAVALALLAAACGSRGPAATQATDEVPWAALPAQVVAPPTALSVPPGTPACKASQIRGHYSGGQGLTGEQVLTGFILADVAARPCVLDGVPEVHLYGSANQQIAVQEILGPALAAGSTPGPVLLLPGLSPLTSPAPPGEAVLDLVWSPVAAPTAFAICPTPVKTASTVGFSIDGTVVLVAAPPGPTAPAIKPCSGKVGVSPFQSVSPAAPPTANLRARIAAPRSVIGGDVLHYTLWLGNATRQSVDLSKVCAAYVETLSGNGYKVVRKYELNCGNAKVLRPGAQQPFAMVMPTMAVSRRMKVIIGWGFNSGGLGLRGGPVSATVIIEPKPPN